MRQVKRRALPYSRDEFPGFPFPDSLPWAIAALFHLFPRFQTYRAYNDRIMTRRQSASIIVGAFLAIGLFHGSFCFSDSRPVDDHGHLTYASGQSLAHAHVNVSEGAKEGHCCSLNGHAEGVIYMKVSNANAFDAVAFHAPATNNFNASEEHRVAQVQPPFPSVPISVPTTVLLI